MQRSQFIAAIVLAVVVTGLLAARFRGGDDDASAGLAGGEQATATAVAGGIAAETSADAGSGDGGAVTGDPGAATSPAGEEASTGGEGADGGGSTDDEAAAPPVLEAKPALTDLDGWLNTDAASLDDFAGQVRIVEFWTFGCFNCKNRLPHTQDLYARYRTDGLEIIGVHAPEFDYERDPQAVAAAAVDLGVTWPVALDTRKTNFRAWQGARRFWPRVYVLDQDGDVRYDHIGEGDYDGLEAVVVHLLEHGP